MKIRGGFVSNSSSSSYIVILPENANYEMLRGSMKPKQFKDLLKESNASEEEVKKSVKALLKHHGLYADLNGSEDEYNAFYAIEGMIQPWVVCTTDGSSDAGNQIIVLDRNKVRKALDS